MSAARMLWRQFNAERWPALLLALSVAILAALSTAAPRLMAALDDRQLTETLSGLSAIQGDVSGSWAQVSHGSPLAGLPDPWEPHRAAMQAVRDAQPEPLRSVLAAPQFLAQVPGDATIVPPPETGYFEARLTFFVDPDLEQFAELVAGAWPRPTAPMAEDRPDARNPTEVVALAEVADRLGWAVGEPIDEHLVLSGTMRPRDPAETRWEHVPYGRSLVEEVDPDRGLRLVGGLFLSPAYLATEQTVIEHGPGVQETLTVETWFGVDTAELADVDVRGLRHQLTGLLTQRHPVLVEDLEGAQPVEIRLDSELGDALTTVAAQQDTTRAAVAVAAVGPIAVAIALVALAAQLVIERRRAAVELVTARGLSGRQLRQLLLAEGLIVGLPAALLGHVIGMLATPGSATVWSWLIAAVLGAAPAAALAWAGDQVRPLRSRSDLTMRPGGARIVAEAVAAIGTAAAVWALLSRGDSPADGLDLLATATPVLVAVTVCLLALRLYPLPLKLLARWRRGGRDLASYLGSVRAFRDPAGGLAPVFTILLGTTIAVLSASLLGSIVASTERATWEANGATIRISGPRITDEVAAGLRGVDGVAEVARIHDAGANHRIAQDGETRVRLWLVEPAVEAAYAAAPDGSPLPAGLFAADGGPAVVVGGQVPLEEGDATLQGIGDVRIIGSLESPPGVRTGAAWGLMSVERWAERQPVPPATLALVSVAAGADVAEVADRLAPVVGNALITTIDAELAAVRDTPTVSGLTTTFAALTAATAGLLALTLFGAQLMATRTRTRLGAVLRTLGTGRRELRALTAWEIAPGAALGLVLGTGLGIGLAALLLATLDFRSLTGGAHSPSLHLDPVLLGAVLGILVATVGLTIAATAWLAGRTNLAAQLRIGEER